MFSLTVDNIKEWLIQNRDKCQKLKVQEFPPFDNALYSMYGHLNDFIEYYKYKHQCGKALSELNTNNFDDLIRWTKRHEILGSQDLLMFEANYLQWNEEVSNDKIKIQEGLYTERKPFENIIFFCRIFQHLYWNNNIHETEKSEKEQKQIQAQLLGILNNSN